MSEFNPSLSVDCVIFGLDISEQALKILVYEREIFPETNSGNKNLKFPGSLLADNQTLDDSAYQVLKDLTGLQDVCLKQFRSFGNPDRIKYKEEREWIERHYGVKVSRVVTVAYYALIRIDSQNPNQSQIKDNLRWINVKNAGNLAFDHSNILTYAREALQKDLILQDVVAFRLLPEKFTLNQLQAMYELILDTNLDKRNFRKKIAKADYIYAIGEKQKGVAHKPAMLYSFDRQKFEKSKETISTFFV